MLASLKSNAKGGDTDERRWRGKAAMQILTVITRLRQLACHGHLVEPDRMPPMARARIEAASQETLVGWIENIIGAWALDEVFGDAAT